MSNHSNNDFTAKSDAIIYYGVDACPQCNSNDTETYSYPEGFSELRCHTCGYDSEAEEISALLRYEGTLLEKEHSILPLPTKAIKA